MKPPKFTQPPMEDDDQPWLLSYADMVTLLLAFFILLVSMSTLNKVKIEMIAQTFAEKKDRMTYKQLQEKIQEFINAENLREEVNVALTPDGIEVNFKDKLLFDLGRADVKSEAEAILNKLSGLLVQGELAKRLITVEGHTDSLPIRSEIYPSNWELSSARAASVVKFFIGKGMDTRRFESVGYADTRPLVTAEDMKQVHATAGATKDARGLAVNRRVIIVISPDSYIEEIERKMHPAK